MLHISDHAIVRYAERLMGVDVEAVAATLGRNDRGRPSWVLRRLERFGFHAAEARKAIADAVAARDARFVVVENTVTTVMLPGWVGRGYHANQQQRSRHGERPKA